MKKGLGGDQMAHSSQKFLTCQAQEKQVPVFQSEMNPKHYIGACV